MFNFFKKFKKKEQLELVKSFTLENLTHNLNISVPDNEYVYRVKDAVNSTKSEKGNSPKHKFFLVAGKKGSGKTREIIEFVKKNIVKEDNFSFIQPLHRMFFKNYSECLKQNTGKNVCLIVDNLYLHCADTINDDYDLFLLSFENDLKELIEKLSEKVNKLVVAVSTDYFNKKIIKVSPFWKKFEINILHEPSLRDKYTILNSLVKHFGLENTVYKLKRNIKSETLSKMNLNDIVGFFTENFKTHISQQINEYKWRLFKPLEENFNDLFEKKIYRDKKVYLVYKIVCFLYNFFKGTFHISYLKTLFNNLINEPHEENSLEKIIETNFNEFLIQDDDYIDISKMFILENDEEFEQKCIDLLLKSKHQKTIIPLLSDLVVELFYQEKVDKSLDWCNYLTDFTNNATFLYNYSAILFFKRAFDEAEKIIAKIPSNDEFFYTYYLSGLIFLMQDRFEDAIACFEKVGSKMHQALHQKAKIFRITGREGEAKTVYKEIIDIGYITEEIGIEYGELLEKSKDYEDAVKLYDRLTNYGASGTYFKYLKARAIMGKGDISVALELVQNIIQAEPFYEALILQGDCLIKLNKIDRAKNAYEKAENFYDDTEVKRKLGYSLFKLNYHSKALMYFEQIINENEASYDDYCYAGILCYKLDCYQKALTYLDSALMFIDNFAPAFLYKGLCYLKLRDYYNASENFKIILIYNKEDLFACFYLGLAEKELGNFIEAAYFIDKAIELLEKADSICQEEFYQDIENVSLAHIWKEKAKLLICMKRFEEADKANQISYELSKKQFKLIY